MTHQQMLLIIISNFVISLVTEGKGGGGELTTALMLSLDKYHVTKIENTLEHNGLKSLT